MSGEAVQLYHHSNVRAVLFSASPADDFVTGQVVEVATGARL